MNEIHSPGTKPVPLIHFLEDLSGRGIELWTDGEQLRYRGPRQLFTPPVLTRLKQDKPQILRLMKEDKYVSRTYPLSYPQRSLWYIYQSAPLSPAYNTALPVRLLFQVDAGILKFALQTLLIRHPCLRTVFSMPKQGGEPVQKVLAYQQVCFEQIDASSQSQEELRERLNQAHQQPFDLEAGPLMRVGLYSRTSDDHVLLISIHHIVCDGWSMWTLVEELWNIYLARLPGAADGSGGVGPTSGESYPELIPSFCGEIGPVLDNLPADIAALAGGSEKARGTGEYPKFIGRLLLHTLRRMGVFKGSGERYDKDELQRQLNILPGYSRLWGAILDILARETYIRINKDKIETAPLLDQPDLNRETGVESLSREKEKLVRSFPSLSAYVGLLWACLDDVPHVLTGKKSYLEVLFPGGSPELVEKTYTGNPLVDYYNHLVAGIVRDYIQKRVKREPETRITILEVGAGTGGTSRFVLEAIRDFGPQVRYIYTDISAAFTGYGEREFGKQYPFADFKVLDIEQPDDDIEPGSLDIVFASHVFHATRNINKTLARTKRLLKTNGLLIVNEMTRLQDMLTLTFGLTDGWWLFEDEENRLSGSPLIGLEQWQRLLAVGGFRKIKYFDLSAVADAGDLSGQQVIIAESDGHVETDETAAPVENPGLPKLSRTYEEYVAWQADLLNSAEGERLRNYWLHRLSGELPVLNLPLDYPRPSIQTYRGSWVPFKVDRESSMRLRQLAGETGVTLFTVLLCAYHILLHRCTGQDDILLGSPTTGRPREAFNGIVGHFVNTVVLRADFSRCPTVREFIGQMKQTVLAALDHQEYPFSLLVDRIKPARDSSRPPVYQTLFVFQKPHNLSDFIDVITDFYAGPARVNLGDLTFESFPISQQEGQFDMSIEMLGTEDSLKGVLKYNLDLFARATLERRAGHFLNLLDCIASHPDLPVWELDYMSDREKQQLLAEWNDTAGEPVVMCAHDLFVRQVEKTVDAVALVFGDSHLGYRELNDRVNRLVRYLIKLGVEWDGRVGICVQRSFEMVIGVIAILKVGAAYVPLDPHYPRERLAFIMEDSRISTLLVNHHLADLFSAGEATFVDVDRDWTKIDAQSRDNIDRQVSPENLTYIIYTSGSTGRPKGIAMVQKTDANLILWQNKISVLSEHGRTLQFTTLNFDISFQETFATLSTGGALVLIPEVLRQDPSALLRLLKKESVQRIFVPFVFLQMLAEAVELDEKLLPGSLREIYTAGEQLRITSAVARLFKMLPDCSLHNHYGPTECYVVTAFTLRGDPDRWPPLPPVGKPIDNVRIYILDRHLQPVPIGVVGEVYIAGICLARGYQNLPDQTGQGFQYIRNPLSRRPERMYGTGDLARYLPDGNIEFLGRSDQQVKIRGFRVEPAEIKNHLLNHPAVVDAVVIDMEEKNGLRSLCAYIVGDGELSIAGITDFLAQKIPAFMLPAYFVQLDKIPRLPSSKVDRDRLPLPDGSMAAGIEYTAPRDEVEEGLAEIWQEILHIEKIGIHDNLFDIGGNSLTTLSIHRRIEALYPGTLHIPDFIRYPTIENLAQVIQNRGAGESEVSDRDEQLQNFLAAVSGAET